MRPPEHIHQVYRDQCWDPAGHFVVPNFDSFTLIHCTERFYDHQDSLKLCPFCRGSVQMKRLGMWDSERMEAGREEPAPETVIHLFVYDARDNKSRVVVMHEKVESESDDDVEAKTVHYHDIDEFIRTFLYEPEPPRMAFEDEDAIGPAAGADPPLSLMGYMAR